MSSRAAVMHAEPCDRKKVVAVTWRCDVLYAWSSSEDSTSVTSADRYVGGVAVASLGLIAKITILPPTLGAGTRPRLGIALLRVPITHGMVAMRTVTGPNPSHWLPGQYQFRNYEPNHNAAYAWSAQQQNYANQSYSPYHPNQQYTSPYTQY